MHGRMHKLALRNRNACQLFRRTHSKGTSRPGPALALVSQAPGRRAPPLWLQALEPSPAGCSCPCHQLEVRQHDLHEGRWIREERSWVGWKFAQSPKLPSRLVTRLCERQLVSCEASEDHIGASATLELPRNLLGPLLWLRETGMPLSAQAEGLCPYRGGNFERSDSQPRCWSSAPPATATGWSGRC